MDDKREVSEETRNGGAKAPFKFFHSSHQIVGSNPSDITAPTDKAVADFVNSSIATNSGRFQGTYETVGDLPLSGVRDNDYAFVVTVKPDGNPEYDRYKFSAQAGWMFEYRLNNSGFTAAQWAAITSGLSAADKARLDAMEDGAQENRIETVKVNGVALAPSGKAVNINAPQGTDETNSDANITAIRIVSSLPENPDANTIYFIRKNRSMPANVVILDSTLPSCSGIWAGKCIHETQTFNLSLPWNNEQQCFGSIESGDYLFFNSQESKWVFFLHTTSMEFLEIPGTDRDVSITETSSFSRKLTLNWSASV